MNSKGYGLRAGWLGFDFRLCKFFPSPRRPDRPQAHLASYPMGTGALSLEIKQPGREADNSPSSSAEVKKTWIYTSTPHTPSWRSSELVKHRDSFTLPSIICLDVQSEEESKCPGQGVLVREDSNNKRILDGSIRGENGRNTTLSGLLFCCPSISLRHLHPAQSLFNISFLRIEVQDFF
jgi:hypothetical protein